MRDYAKIEPWRLADDLTVAVYETSRSFPREELYALTKAVAAESGKLTRAIALASSALVLLLARAIPRP